MRFDWYLQQNGISKERPFVKASVGFRLKNDPTIPTLFFNAVKDSLTFQQFCLTVWEEVVCAPGPNRDRAHAYFYDGLKLAVGSADAKPRPLLRLKSGREHDMNPTSYTELKAPKLNIDAFTEDQVLAVLAKPLRAYLRIKRKEASAVLSPSELNEALPMLPGEKPEKKATKASGFMKKLPIGDFLKLATGKQ
jgi:hypothetical protein